MINNLISFCWWLHNMNFIGGNIQNKRYKNKRILDFVKNNPKFFLLVMYATGVNNLNNDPGNTLSYMIMMIYYNKAKTIFSKFI